MEAWYAKRVTAAHPQLVVAFSVPKLPGRIYVSADNVNSVMTACASLSGIFSRTISMVPEEDRRLVIAAAKHERHDIPDLRPGSFVRIRRGPYAGDVAAVVKVHQIQRRLLDPLKLQHLADKANVMIPSGIAVRLSESFTPPPVSDASQSQNEEDSHSDVVDVWVVPRIDLTFGSGAQTDVLKEPGATRERKRRRICRTRPPPVKFDPFCVSEALRKYGLGMDPNFKLELSNEANTWVFKQRTYESGFHRLRVLGFHKLKPVHPTPDEIYSFIGSVAGTRAITNSAYTRVGDRVKTSVSIGVVTHMSNAIFTVMYDKEDFEEEKVDKVEAAGFVRVFEVGQWVLGMVGPYTDRCGMVAAVTPHSLTVVDPTMKELVCTCIFS